MLRIDRKRKRLLDVTGSFQVIPAALNGMDTGLVRVGHYVVNRRVALGYKHRIDFANDLPITDRTLADIENGVREVSVGTYAALENNLGWGPGSVEAIRAGHEPTELHTGIEEPPLAASPAPQQLQQALPANPLKSVSTEELLLELRRRIVWHPFRPDSDERGWEALISRGDLGEES
jgi:hypothetical protein